MGDTTEERLLASIRKVAGLVTRGIVTAPEFIGKDRNEFACTDAVYPGVISPLCEAVPGTIRSEFSCALRESERPDFCWFPVYLSIGPPLTDEALRLGTERIRARSVVLVRSIDGHPVS
jgi:hypothetical protein